MFIFVLFTQTNNNYGVEVMKKIFKDENLSNKSKINVLILAMLVCGIFGFILETVIYYIKLGEFEKRGSAFGPIIPIYMYGALLIILVTYRFKDKPLLVFIINTILTGIVEFGVGYILLEFFDKRLWNYNNEFLNIKGIICAKSVLSFGLFSLLLIYVILPILFKIVKKVPEKTMTIVSYSLGIISLVDIVTYLIVK